MPSTNTPKCISRRFGDMGRSLGACRRSSPLLAPRRQPTTCRPHVVRYGSILSLDLDARLPYGPDHGTTEREGGRRDRRSLGDRRGHRAAVRDGRGEGGLRRPRRRAGQADRGSDRGERRRGCVLGSARGTRGGGRGLRSATRAALQPAFCAKAAIPLLRQASSGSIVNVASVRSVTSIGKTTQYDTTKAAVAGLTRGGPQEPAAHPEFFAASARACAGNGSSWASRKARVDCRCPRGPGTRSRGGFSQRRCTHRITRSKPHEHTRKLQRRQADH